MPAKASSTLPFRNYTLAELLYFNGQDRPQILLALSSKVYDVSSAPHYYGPEGTYSSFAGRDASRSLASNKIIKFPRDTVQPLDDLADLDAAERDALDSWRDFYDNKYPCVGRIVEENHQPRVDGESPLQDHAQV